MAGFGSVGAHVRFIELESYNYLSRGSAVHMAVFAGSYTMWSQISREQIFGAATDPVFLTRWFHSQLGDIRIQGGSDLHKGSRFRADDPFGFGVKSKDHLYEVHLFEPPHVFGVRCLEGPSYSGELVLMPQDDGTQLRWTHSASPTNLADAALSKVLRSNARRTVERSAKSELSRLIELIEELDHADASQPSSDNQARGDSLVTEHIDTLLRLAVDQARQEGDRLLEGQHFLLAMFVSDDSGWLALRWAGAELRTFATAGIRETSQAQEHEDQVPASAEVQRALEFCRETANGRPISSASVLAALMHFGEAGAVRTITGAGLRQQDVLDAIWALAHLDLVDAVTGEIINQSRRPTVKASNGYDGADEEDDSADEPVMVRAEGFTEPEREAALALFQFKRAIIAGLGLALMLAALVAAVGVAADGPWWMLFVIPVIGLGNPLWGSASMLLGVCLYWWLGVPTVAVLLLCMVPLDSVMGAQTQLSSELQECPPSAKSDLHLRRRHILAALFHVKAGRNFRQQTMDMLG